jgi:hypothetical protein
MNVILVHVFIMSRIVFISVDIDVILYTVDDTTFGKRVVYCLYDNYLY